MLPMNKYGFQTESIFDMYVQSNNIKTFTLKAGTDETGDYFYANMAHGK